MNIEDSLENDVSMEGDGYVALPLAKAPDITRERAAELRGTETRRDETFASSGTVITFKYPETRA